ncbi:MAG: hypothetical protein WCK58_10170 [Chloroflexota bacterium]
MPKQERPWEEPRRDEGGISAPVSMAMALAFTICAPIAIGMLGLHLRGVLAGCGVGLAISLVIARLAVMSSRNRSAGPPPPLL